MNYLKNAWKWVVYSSENPDNISLTLKGGIPFVLLVLGWAHFAPQVNAEILNQDADNLVQLLVSISQVGTGIIAILGFARKIINSFYK